MLAGGSASLQNSQKFRNQKRWCIKLLRLQAFVTMFRDELLGRLVRPLAELQRSMGGEDDGT